jgi:DNA (cytosine-5)-methyltransferase 1
MAIYYNEFDGKAAAWLRELIADGLIPEGDVDERSIAEVTPPELRGYTQCHFFAGIGGWAYALRLAGWPDDAPVWTGSCPCQPFSCAGKRAGLRDKRHLWPVFCRLIAECGPPVVFGEQVASAAGREWLSGVRTSLEYLGYSVGAADLCAAGVGAPHIRQRLFWVANAEYVRRQQQSGAKPVRVFDKEAEPEECVQPACGSGTGACDFWSNAIWLSCRDGKSRRVEPSIFPLADGLPGRVGLLRGAGNAIVPEVAAAFVEACAVALGARGTR